MELFMDIDSIPTTYRLFPGNTPDKITLIPILGKIQYDYSLGRIIVVTNRGITQETTSDTPSPPKMAMY